MIKLTNTDHMTFDFGHRTAYDGGAVGIVTEDSVTDAYGSKVISKLTSLGIVCHNCTPTSATSLSHSLVQRCNAENSFHKQFNTKLHLSFHANAYDDPSANGCEAEYISTNAGLLADIIISNICEALNVRNRGKVYRDNLYVLNHTISPCILLEPIFVTSKSDVSKFNADKCSDAIVKSLTGLFVKSPAPSTPAAPIEPTIITSIQSLLNLDGLRDSSNNKLVVDGIAGKATFEAASKYRQSSCPFTTKFLQSLLIRKGYSLGSPGADGVFGPKTRVAVTAFQLSRGLVPDGIIGINTIKALIS